jgi:hypothetical protein
MSEVDISDLFVVPNELKDKIKQKKPKVKKELSEDKKEELRERLKKARAVAKKNREAKLAKKEDPSTKVETAESQVEPDTEIDTTATETQSEVENNSKNIVEDNNLEKLEKRKENNKKLGNIIAKRKQTINNLVEEKVNQKFKEMEEINSKKISQGSNQTKKVQIVEPPKPTPAPAPVKIAPPVIKPKVIRRTFKKFPWE